MDGIAGRLDGTVRECVNKNNIKGTLEVGGVVGCIISTGKVEHCSNSGKVTGNSY